jgi:hypothetical protein
VTSRFVTAILCPVARSTAAKKYCETIRAFATLLPVSGKYRAVRRLHHSLGPQLGNHLAGIPLKCRSRPGGGDSGTY